MTTGKSQKRQYSCANCGANVEKYAKCGTVAAHGKEKSDYAGLSGWRCFNGCKPCKVKVDLFGS